MLEFLTNLLPVALRPYAKAVYPFILTLVATALTWAFTGEFNQQEIRTAVTGLVMTLLTFGVPNVPPGEVDHDVAVAIAEAEDEAQDPRPFADDDYARYERKPTVPPGPPNPPRPDNHRPVA